LRAASCASCFGRHVLRVGADRFGRRAVSQQPRARVIAEEFGIAHIAAERVSQVLWRLKHEPARGRVAQDIAVGRQSSRRSRASLPAAPVRPFQFDRAGVVLAARKRASVLWCR
jgi:hypothetical protein